MGMSPSDFFTNNHWGKFRSPTITGETCEFMDVYGTLLLINIAMEARTHLYHRNR